MTEGLPDNKPKRTRGKKTIEEKRKAQMKKRRGNPLYKEFFKKKKTARRRNVSLDDTTQSEVVEQIITEVSDKDAQHGVADVGQPTLIPGPLPSYIRTYLLKKGTPDRVPIFEGLVGGPGALGAAIACNSVMITALAEQIVSLVLAKMASEPGQQLFVSKLHIGDNDTTIARAEIGLSQLVERGKKYAAAISPDALMIVTPMVLTDALNDESDVVVRSELLVLSFGGTIEGKVASTTQKLGYLFPDGIGNTPGIATCRIDSDPASMETALRKMVQEAISFARRDRIANVGEGCKPACSKPEWALRTCEVLGLLDLDAIFIAKGNLSGSLSDLRRTARRIVKKGAKGGVPVISLGAFRHVFIDLWPALGREYRTPTIL